MPTVTTKTTVTLEDTAQALKRRLGSRYDISLHGTGPQQALKIKQSAAALATVHGDHDAGTTVFHIHGGGLVISRMVNEFGIAKRVAAAIDDTYNTTTAHDDGGR